MSVRSCIHEFDAVRSKRCSSVKLMAERICKTKKMETCVSVQVRLASVINPCTVLNYESYLRWNSAKTTANVKHVEILELVIVGRICYRLTSCLSRCLKWRLIEDMSPCFVGFLFSCWLYFWNIVQISNATFQPVSLPMYCCHSR